MSCHQSQDSAGSLVLFVLAYNLGLTYLKTGDPGPALTYFQQAAQSARDYALAHLGWGAALEKQSDWRLALEYYGRVLELCPGHELALQHVKELWAQHSHAAPAGPQRLSPRL